MPCLVQNFKSDDDKMLNLVFMNVTARRLSDAELWTSYEKVDAILKKKKEAGEKFGRIRDALANLLGVSASQVSKLQNVEKNAIDKIKEAVSNGSISISTANEIARLDEEEQAAIVNTNDLSTVRHKDVKDKIDKPKKVATYGNHPDITNLEKSATYGNFTIKDTYIDLLDRITERYNAEVLANYHDGIIDYVPKDKTSSEMLEIILCRYALENYEDLLRTSD